MRKWQTGLALLCCGALILTGCSRQEQERSRRELQAAKAENDALRRQVKVLQDNVKILQNELAVRAAGSAEAPAVPGITPVKAPTTETKGKPSEQVTSRDLTRTEFKNKVLGMRPQELTRFAGSPDSLLPADDSERWVYDRLPCKNSEGNVELVRTHILLENGRVIRVLFMDDIRYGM